MTKEIFEIRSNSYAAAACDAQTAASLVASNFSRDARSEPGQMLKIRQWITAYHRNEETKTFRLGTVNISITFRRSPYLPAAMPD